MPAAAERDRDAHWRELAEEVLTGFREWREAHPTATLAEIEAALDARWAGRPRPRLGGRRADEPGRRPGAQRGAAALPPLRGAAAGGGAGAATADHGARTGPGPGTDPRPVPALRRRGFPPSMRSWASSPVP